MAKLVRQTVVLWLAVVCIVTASAAGPSDEERTTQRKHTTSSASAAGSNRHNGTQHQRQQHRAASSAQARRHQSASHPAAAGDEGHMSGPSRNEPTTTSSKGPVTSSVTSASPASTGVPQIRSATTAAAAGDAGSYEDDYSYDPDGHDIGEPTWPQSTATKGTSTAVGGRRHGNGTASTVLTSLGGSSGENSTEAVEELRLQREDSKAIRLNAIKEQILSKLRLKAPPNITNKTLPKINHFIELKKKIDAQHSNATNDATTHKVINFPSPLPAEKNFTLRGVCYFTFQPEVMSVRIVNATFWFFVRAPTLPQKQSSTILLVSKLVPSNSKSGPNNFKKQIVFNKRVSYLSLKANKALNGSWFNVEVKSLVDDWLKKPESNLGLQLEVFDGSGNPLSVTDYDEENRPFVELETQESGMSRAKRTPERDCDEQSPEERCCRYPLEVDFEEFGWEWVIAPKVYKAHYCSGECPFVFLPLYPHTHITQQAADRHQRLTSGPCCTPAKMSPISMLYFDERGNIIYGTLSDMVVDRCGCA